MIFEKNYDILTIPILEQHERKAIIKKYLTNLFLAAGIIHSAFMAKNIDKYAEFISNNGSVEDQQQIINIAHVQPNESPEQIEKRKQLLQDKLKELENKDIHKEVEDFKPVEFPKYQFTEELLNNIRQFENAKLYTGKIKTDKKRWDRFGKINEIGYGFNQNGIHTAIRYGKLKENFKLPDFMTKQQADDFLVKVMLPAFEDAVRTHVTVPLNRKQLDALISFTYNLGEKNLKRLVGKGYTTPEFPERLNQGKYETVPEIINLYNKARVKKDTKKSMDGLERRRDMEAELFRQGTSEMK